MADVSNPGPAGYHLDERSPGISLVRRAASGMYVGRVYETGDAHRGRWVAELGPLKVVTPYPSRQSAIAAVCAYADANPDLRG